MAFQWRNTVCKNKTRCIKNVSSFMHNYLQCRLNVIKKERLDFCLSSWIGVFVQDVHVPLCVQEKLILHEQLWQSGAELQQQADFCSGLGSTTCRLLWSSSTRENIVTHWLADVSHLESIACILVLYIAQCFNHYYFLVCDLFSVALVCWKARAIFCCFHTRMYMHFQVLYVFACIRWCRGSSSHFWQ